MITYTSATKTFTVSTTDISKLKTTQIKINGKLGVFDSVDYIFNLHVVCNVNTMSISFPMSDYTYIVEN